MIVFIKSNDVKARVRLPGDLIREHVTELQRHTLLYKLPTLFFSQTIEV